jgi:Ca2+-transporting ATPase
VIALPPLVHSPRVPCSLMVILFTVIAQWLIVEYGGDLTQTYPLRWDEWKYTVALGAGSLPVSLVMRWIPVTESPDTFAGK